MDDSLGFQAEIRDHFARAEARDQARLRRFTLSAWSIPFACLLGSFLAALCVVR